MTAMTLMLLEDFEPFARLVKEAFPEIRWHLVHDVDTAARLLDNEVLDGCVVDVHINGEPSGLGFVEHTGDAPVLILTSDRDPLLVSQAQQLGVAINYKADWKAAIKAFAKRARESLRFRLRAFADEHKLTRRELEVLGLFIEDYGRSEIAEHLGISEWTVREHLRAVLAKTPLPRLAEVRRFIRRGA